MTIALSARSYISLLNFPGCSDRASSMTARSASTCVRGDTAAAAPPEAPSEARERRALASPPSSSATISSARIAQSLRTNALYCSPNRVVAGVVGATRRSPRHNRSEKNLSSATTAVRHVVWSLASARTHPRRRSTPSAGSLEVSVLTETPSVAASLRPMASEGAMVGAAAV